MADSTTNPWIIGGIALGAAAVIYFLYVEYQAGLAAQANASANAATTATATGAANGIIASAIPDQLSTASPSYPATATVMPQGTVTGTSTAEPTGTPAPAPVVPPTSTGAATPAPVTALASPISNLLLSVAL